MGSLPSNRPLCLQAGSSHQLVEQLRAMSALGTEVSLFTFMNRFAWRFTNLTDGLLVRTDTTDNFVADLMAHGWIKIVL